VASCSKAFVCGCFLAGIAGSNLCLVNIVCCQVEVSADHSSRGVRLSVVCLSVIVGTSTIKRPWPTRGRHVKAANKQTNKLTN
jgi:hypothetical protein